MGTLKLQSNGPLYSSTVIGTLAVDGWAVTFGTARRGFSRRSAPIPDIFYFENTPEVTSVQHSLKFDCIIDYFLYRALEAACAAYTCLNLSLLHYITTLL